MNRGHAAGSAWGFSHISPRKTDDVLDIGCGGGANLSVFLKKYPDGTVTGIDYSPVSVETSLKMNRHAVSAGKCRVLRGNVSALPFDDEAFDIITAFETIYFWPDIGNAFRQILRVLKGGGTCMICTGVDGSGPEAEKWMKLVDGMIVYSGNELIRLLESAGFIEVTVYRNTDRPWLCVIAKKPQNY
ncbi:MAG: class I SAM-dependent methyltransferase [Methanocalculaceae archaeon]|nr:class I SAM-dependent methyltransferase [Methanocalculaceae archaeon]